MFDGYVDLPSFMLRIWCSNVLFFDDMFVIRWRKFYSFQWLCWSLYFDVTHLMFWWIFLNEMFCDVMTDILYFLMITLICVFSCYEFDVLMNYFLMRYLWYDDGHSGVLDDYVDLCSLIIEYSHIIHQWFLDIF